MIAFSEKESQTQNIPPISQKKNYVLKTDLLKHSFTSSTTSQFDEENNNLIQSYFANCPSFPFLALHRKDAELKPSKNFKPKRIVTSIYEEYEDGQEDIVEEVVKNSKSDSTSSDVSKSPSNYYINNNINQNFQIIINENNNFFTQLNSPANFNPQLQNFQNVKPPMQSNITSYNDESLVQLSSYLIKEQNGSRTLQRKLKSDLNFANNMFFTYLTCSMKQAEVFELICDQFGNYFFQTLLDCLTNPNILTFIRLIKDKFYDISINNHGTRVIQKLISVVKKDNLLLDEFIKTFRPLVERMLEESHGNHIVQKFLEEVKDESRLQFLYEILFRNIVKVSTHKFGCCTIQKLFIESSPREKEKLFRLIQENIFQIIYKQYGSYVFQYIIEKEPLDMKVTILKEILPSLLKICKTKYSSNAIEKCFEFSFKEIHEIIIKKICESDSYIEELITDPYGNYIIQKALCVCGKEYYTQIISVIGKNTEKIKQLNFGYKLISKLLIQHKELGEFIISK